jgi:hypothetical protein
LDLDRSTGGGIAFNDKVLRETLRRAFKLAGSGQRSRSPCGVFILVPPQINFVQHDWTRSETKGQRAAL